MTILTPTKDTGGQTKAHPLVYGEPAQRLTDDDLAAQLPMDGINTAVLADLLSAYLTHERCGRHLYRSVAGRSKNPVLARHYEEFGEETERHVEILEQLIVTSGGNPSYVSPLARAVEATGSKLLESTFLTDGALDPVTAEAAMLDAVLIAETLDHANWSTLQQVCAALPPGDIRSAFEQAVGLVLDQESEHLGWARDSRASLTLMQLPLPTG